MCLENTKRRRIKEGEGYIVASRDSTEKVVVPLYGTPRERYTVKKWYTAKTIYISSGRMGCPYVPGFHIFINLLDAQRYSKLGNHKVYSVKFKRGYLSGNLNFYPCIVAKERMVVCRTS
jgi:hypothetical protein